MSKTGIVEGKDLMLYINTSTNQTPTWLAVAHSKTHTISTSAETKDRQTKDSSGVWKTKVVTGLSSTIKCDALKSYDGYGYFELKAKMLARETVMLKYSPVSEATGDKYEQGTFLITSIEENSPAGEDATYSVTFENSGAVTIETKA